MGQTQKAAAATKPVESRDTRGDEGRKGDGNVCCAAYGFNADRYGSIVVTKDGGRGRLLESREPCTLRLLPWSVVVSMSHAFLCMWFQPKQITSLPSRVHSHLQAPAMQRLLRPPRSTQPFHENKSRYLFRAEKSPARHIFSQYFKKKHSSS